MKKLLIFFLFINSLFAIDYKSDSAYVDSAYVSGIMYYAEKDYEKSKLAFEESISNCPKCNIESYSYLSQHYNGTIREEKNLQKAFELNLKGAKLGHAGAQFGMAEYYQYGTGTKKDIQKAVYWYKKAIEQKTEISSVSSMFNLGILYYSGEGNVAMDKKLAYKYWMKCVDSDVPYPQAKDGCQNNLDILCKQSPWACK